jgi:hypothetical protein
MASARDWQHAPRGQWRGALGSDRRRAVDLQTLRRMRQLQLVQPTNARAEAIDRLSVLVGAASPMRTSNDEKEHHNGN